MDDLRKEYDKNIETNSSTILKCGHYQSTSGGSGSSSSSVYHSFASVEENGNTHWYDCYGGHDGEKKRDYPAILWRKKNPLFPAKRTNKRSASTDLAWTNAIAGWGSPDPQKIQRAGAGLVYALTGVCHQMCNSVMYPSKPNGYSYGYLNFAPAYRASWVLYGTYGFRQDILRMKAFKGRKPNSIYSNAYKNSFSVEMMTVSQITSQLDDQELFHELNNTFKIEDNITQAGDFVSSYKEILKRKHEIDLSLLRGEYHSTDKVANDLGTLLVDSTQLIYNIRGNEDEFENNFSNEISMAASIVRPEFIDLELCEQLGNRINIERF